LEDVPVVAVDPSPLTNGDRVSVVGFGCTVGVLVPDVRDAVTMKYAETRIVAAERAMHAGSVVLPADLPQVSGIYSMTAGPRSAKAPQGPLSRRLGRTALQEPRRQPRGGGRQLELHPRAGHEGPGRPPDDQLAH